MALFCALSFANDIDDIASKAIIIANHSIYSGCPAYPIQFAIADEFISINTTKIIDETISDINAVLYAEFTSLSFLEKRKKAVSNPYVNMTTKKAT